MNLQGAVVLPATAPLAPGARRVVRELPRERTAEHSGGSPGPPTPSHTWLTGGSLGPAPRHRDESTPAAWLAGFGRVRTVHSVRHHCITSADTPTAPDSGVAGQRPVTTRPTQRRDAERPSLSAQDRHTRTRRCRRRRVHRNPPSSSTFSSVLHPSREGSACGDELPAGGAGAPSSPTSFTAESSSVRVGGLSDALGS